MQDSELMLNFTKKNGRGMKEIYFCSMFKRTKAQFDRKMYSKKYGGTIDNIYLTNACYECLPSPEETCAPTHLLFSL